MPDRPPASPEIERAADAVSKLDDQQWIALKSREDQRRREQRCAHPPDVASLIG